MRNPSDQDIELALSRTKRPCKKAKGLSRRELAAAAYLIGFDDACDAMLDLKKAEKERRRKQVRDRRSLKGATVVGEVVPFIKPRRRKT